jgi:DNA-binding NarL/FixJ family response regulator
MPDKPANKTNAMTSAAKFPKVRVVIVDDHAVVRMGLRMLIDREKDLVVCGEAGNRADALGLIAREIPDLVVVDMCLGEESGLDLIKDIAAQHPGVRSIVLSMLRETVYAERAFQAGAMGYVMKQDRPDTLITALRAIINNGLYVGDAVAQQMARKMMNTGHPMQGAPSDILADRELQVFERLGEGFAPGEIARTMHLSVKTIGTYRERIKQKLGLTSARELSHYAVEWMRTHRS